MKLEDGAVWLDLTDPPLEARRARVLASLEGAFDDEDYERMARELARLSALGDPLEALRAAISWSWERLEYGWTHGYAGMACFGFTGCRDTVPHLQRLAVYTGEALADLEHAVLHG